MRSSRSPFRSVVVALVVAGVGAGMLSGCSRSAKYRANPTPELDTLSMSRDEIDNRLTVTNDSNARMINRDFGYFWMLDRPSRLTPQPVGW
jgi:hypothetical protein